MKKRLFIGIFSVLLLYYPCFVVFGADVKKIAILPFKVSADKDLGYLSEGLQDMLSTRLSHPGQTQIVPKEQLKKALAQVQDIYSSEAAVEIGKVLGSDYVIVGNVTVLGNSFSLDCKVVPMSAPSLGFSSSIQGKSLDSLIPELDRFAQDINSKLFGKVAAREAMSGAEEETSREEGPRTPHPSFRGYRYGLDIRNYWRSKGFGGEIWGMDVGDVDGDGANELVVAVEDKIEVYTIKNRLLHKVASFESGDREPYIAVDVADINKNGRAEIFVSKVKGEFVSSEVLEYSGGKLVTILRDQRYLYRVIEWPGEGKVLLGQEKATRPEEFRSDLINAYLGSGVFKLQWNGREYVASDRVGLRGIKHFYVYNFAVADLDGDGSLEFITIDGDNRLNVFSATGERVYKSPDQYGGTLSSIVTNPDKESSYGRQSLDASRIWLPGRILVADVDDDGKKEVIVTKNSTSIGFTERFRSYSDGKVVALKYSGMSLDPLWETRRLTGCITDIQIKDLHNDGNPHLVLSIVQETGVRLLKDARSIVVSYPLKSKN